MLENPGTEIPGEALPDNLANEYETIAREKGWRPKEEFDGDDDSWVDAQEFVKRQPLFDKIKTQSKKMKELEKTVESLAKHYQITMKQAKDKAIAELKAERVEAIELGEVAKVEEIDQRIIDVKKVPDPVAPNSVMPVEVEAFVEEHKDWFNKNQEMTDFAVAYNESYLKKNPGNLEKSLEETLKVVKRAFPEHFANGKRQSPPPVEGATTATKGASKYSLAALTKEQKLVYQQLVVNHKQMSHDEYFKDLESAGYLGN